MQFTQEYICNADKLFERCDDAKQKDTMDREHKTHLFVSLQKLLISPHIHEQIWDYVIACITYCKTRNYVSLIRIYTHLRLS